jgi:hypothetical protein
MPIGAIFTQKIILDNDFCECLIGALWPDAGGHILREASTTDEKPFAEFPIPPCGHVCFCKDCYPRWLNEKPNGGCPLGCPVPFKDYYTPYTFPNEWELRYDVVGDVEEAAAQEQAEAPAASAPVHVVEAVQRPPPGSYDAFSWMLACGIASHVASDIIGKIINRLCRQDVWTLLEVDPDLLGLMRFHNTQVRRAAAALGEARASGAIADDGTLSG